MAKITFSDIASGFQSVSTLNNNFAQLEYELQNKVLYRTNPTGEPNQMDNDLDMNGYNILNLGNATVVASASSVQTILWGTQRNGTGTHSLSAGDIYRTVEVSASSSVTAVMFLTTASIAGWVGGQWISLLQKGAGKVLISSDAGVTINCSATVKGTRRQYGTVTLKYRGSDVWYLDGDVSV
jgi:hypothetical protein